MTADQRKPPATAHGRTLAGFRTAAKMTPEERSERARAGAVARWAREEARRAEVGEKPLKRRPPEPSAEELTPWLEEVDRRYPDRQWPNREARRRQAILLLRTAAAEAASAAMKRRGDA